MKRSEFPYQGPRNESCSSRYPATTRTEHSKPRGSLNDDMEKRIVMLYTNGESVESITKEVGRARHRIVHILQARGLLANSQPGLRCKEPEDKLFASEELKEEPTIEDRTSEQFAVERPGAEIAGEEPPGNEP